MRLGSHRVRCTPLGSPRHSSSSSEAARGSRPPAPDGGCRDARGRRPGAVKVASLPRFRKHDCGPEDGCGDRFRAVWAKPSIPRRPLFRRGGGNATRHASRCGTAALEVEEVVVAPRSCGGGRRLGLRHHHRVAKDREPWKCSIPASGRRCHPRSRQRKPPRRFPGIVPFAGRLQRPELELC